MPCIVTIVEGHGEVEAVPILVRRIASAVGRLQGLAVPKPIRVPRGRLLKQGEMERTVELAARLAEPEGCILILLDADTDCPRTLADEILRRARSARPDRSIRAVVANTEYEAWFVAAAESIAGQRGIMPNLSAPAEPEAIRDAKGWLTAQMPHGRSYHEILDQPALTTLFDLDLARGRARSFRKMWEDVAALLGSPV